MKSLRNKVIMSAIVLVFAVIATIGSTYAWFTVSNETTAAQMDVTVASSESLLMRAWRSGETENEGDTYLDYGWSLDDFTTVVDITDSPYYANYDEWRLLPVTALAGETVNTTNYNSIDVSSLRYLSDVNTTTRPLAAATENNSGGHFLEFKFWLLTPSDTKHYITFDFDVTTTDATNYENALHVGVIGDSIELVDVDDIDFTSVGVNADTISSDTIDLTGFEVGDVITVTGGLNDGNTYTVNAVNDDVTDTLTVDEVVVAESGATITLAENAGGESQKLFGDTYQTTLDYGYAWTAVDAGFSSTSALNSVSTDLSTQLAAIEGEKDVSVINCLESANVPELVTVRVWIEGWDTQTTNAVMGATFDLNIRFNLR